MYEYEQPAYSPRFRPHNERMFAQAPAAPIPPNGTMEASHMKPQAIVLLTPRAQPTVVWPMGAPPLDENSYHRSPLGQHRSFLHSPPQQHHHLQQHFFPAPVVYSQEDPLANYRRFPHQVLAAAPVVYETPPLPPPAQPILIPCEEYTPRIYSHHSRKTLWKPRQTTKTYSSSRDFQPRAIMPRSLNNPDCNKLSPTSVTSSSNLEQSNGDYFCPIHSPQLSSLSLLNSLPSSTVDKKNITPSAKILSPPSSPLPSLPLDKKPSTTQTTTASTSALQSPVKEPPPMPSNLSSSASSVSFSTPGVQKRRRKQTKADNSIAVVSAPSSWTTLTWKTSRWLLSHEKAVVRLLLCLLMVGAFVLAMTKMESTTNEVFIEAENWSKPKYDWIDL